MLVLSRKVGESLLIGPDTTITINRVAGNRVTIGIDAPQAVSVVRAEVAEREQRERDGEKRDGEAA